jgi:ubiquitin-protein ligase
MADTPATQTEVNAARRQLAKMFSELEQNPSTYFSCGLIDDDLFRWRCTIFGPEGTPFAGGFFPTELTFTGKYPNFPPKMRFLCPMWHPNVHKDNGTVCISILHPPGKDPHQYESQTERWLPIHSVESIVVSVLSMLLDPNIESPLNVDAARDFRTDRDSYNRKIIVCATRSVEYC